MPKQQSRCSSVGILNRLRAKRYEVRAPVESEDFSLLQKCPDRFWGPPGLPLNDDWSSLPGVKRPGRAAKHSPPRSVDTKNEWSYTSTECRH